jgi:hypothetical protein
LIAACLSHSKVILIVWITVVGLAIVIQITVMTKRILRAIELASRK